MADRTHQYHGEDHTRDSRGRSRSPQTPKSQPHSHRTRSPHRHHHHHHHRHHHSSAGPAVPITLPYNSRQLTKRDYETFKPLFGLYLDIQKGKVLEELNETEVKGRWKSFFGKWNRGEISEGWYDPATLLKAKQSESAAPDNSRSERPRSPAMASAPPRRPSPGAVQDESDSDDSVGPTLPGQEGRSRQSRMGPSIPNLQDLEFKREMEQEDGLARRDDIRFERKLDRRAQKAALDELVPRAEAGTRERQLEKKQEINATMKAFREKSPGAAEVPDQELMGGGDGIEGFKKVKQEFERKKNERELRKEEILRARMAEREERLGEYRAKEEETMKMLKSLAKQKFG